MLVLILSKFIKLIFACWCSFAFEMNLVGFDESGKVCIIVVILCDLDDNCVLKVCKLVWYVNVIIKIWPIKQFDSSFILWKIFGHKILKGEYQIDQLDRLDFP